MKSAATLLLIVAIPFLEQAKSQSIPASVGTTDQLVFEFSKVVASQSDVRLRAVAFHSIMSIDSTGRSLREIVFGTATTDSILRDGWFVRESDAEIGTFQWSGGASKRATLDLSVPSGTEGLLIKLKSIEDTMNVTVRLNGVIVTNLWVDTPWHTGYVPVGPPRPEVLSTVGPQWIPGRFFPRFPSTNKVYMIPMVTPITDSKYGTWTMNWRISQSKCTMHALTLVGMQGLINRNKPSVYLDWNETTESSHFWISEVQKYVEVKYLDLDPLSAMNFLMRKYPSAFGGAVIYDPEVVETINLATTYAGLENRIMLAPDQLSMPGMPVFNNIRDLRDLVRSQGWDDSEKSKLAIDKYVYDNLWPQMEHHIVGTISPGPPLSYDLGNGAAFPLVLGPRDLVVALKLPAIYPSPVDSAQRDLLKKFIKETPFPRTILGTVGGYEDASTSLISENGGWNPYFTNPGASLSIANITVLSGIRPSLARYNPEIRRDKIIATLGDKPAATMYSSDGDALLFTTDRGFHDFFVWPEVNSQQFGWEINPSISEVAPLIWNYYVNSSARAGLVCGFSGIGFADPTLMSDNQLHSYLQLTELSLKETGLRTMHINDVKIPWNDSAATRYYLDLKDSDYLGAFLVTGGGQFGICPEYRGYPTPAIRTAYTLNGTNYNDIIKSITQQKPGESFMPLGCHPELCNSEAKLITDQDAYGGKALYVPKAFRNSPTYSMFFSSHPLNLISGDYDIVVRLKVPDKSSGMRIATLNVGERFAYPDWKMLKSYDIAPRDFLQPNRYQEFKISCAFDSTHYDVEVRLDYGDGVDLYVDWVRITRKGSTQLPNFASLFIGLCVPPELMQGLTNVPTLFQNEFERVGGTILRPDEFVAALNPEYMIRFAEPILGTSHPQVVAAKNLLTSKKIVESLLAIRGALADRLLQQPVLSVGSRSIDLKSVPLGSVRDTLLTVRNVGNQVLVIQDIRVMNPRFQSLLRTANVPAGGSIVDTIRFFPTLAKVESTVVVIVSNSINGSGMNDTLWIIGTGFGAMLKRSTNSIEMQSVTVGGYKDTTVTVKNVGNDTLRISGRASSNPVFNVRAGGAIVAPGSTITDTIRFQPTSATAVSAYLITTSNSTPSRDTIFISGRASSVPPSVPTLTGPADSAINIPLSPTLSWNAVAEAAFYHLQLASAAIFTTCIVDDSTLTTSSRATGPLSLGTTYYWRVRAKNEGGYGNFSATRQFRTIRTTSVEQTGEEIPKEYALSQNYPNPFNPATVIKFAVPKQSFVRLVVFDMLGRNVVTLISEELPAGYFRTSWNANIPSGVYIYRLQAGDFVETKKMLLLK